MSEANAQPTDKAAARAKQLKAEIKTFRLELLYNGQEDKPFYRLILSVPPIGYERSNPFYRLAQITEAQAEGWLSPPRAGQQNRKPRPR